MRDDEGTPVQSATVPLETAVEIAVQLHRRGELQSAETIYRDLLKLVPEHPDVLHFLGVLLHQLGQGEEAVRLIRRAIERVPDHPGMHLNLGNVLKEQGRLAEAEQALGRVLELSPEHADAYNNLGVVYKAQKRYREAADAYLRAIELAPDHADAHLNLGNVLRRLGRVDEAVRALQRAIELKPDQSAAYENLATALRRAGRGKEAVAVVQQWLQFAPDHPIAAHMLAAFGGEAPPERASDAYIVELFDRFAGSFDECLRSLEYRAPQRLAELLEEMVGPGRGQGAVLDAGCGTGLCAPLLRPHARRLVGVDLSSAMVHKAEGLGLYDQLVVSELTDYLQGTDETFDLVASADTLVYFGDLSPVLAAAARAVRPGGWLLFTLEQAEGDAAGQAGYRLNEHGRYSHAAAYVEAALARAGFGLRAVREESLRLEGGEQVPGLLVAARREEATPG